MAIGDLGFAFERVKTRLGRVFVSADAGTTWIEVGRCRDVKLTSAKVVTPTDQNGREKQLAHDVDGNFVLTQTDDTDIVNTDALLHPTGSGLWVKFTDATATTATAGAAEGMTAKNALLTLDSEFDFGGNASFMAFNFKGRVSIDGFKALGDTDQDVIFG